MKEKDKYKEYEAELAWVRNYISKPILVWVIE